jgi:ribonucleotide monophosphatase NagD (HAD superfamily)
MDNLNLDRREIVVVGDRVSTDIQGAVQSGMRSVLLRTGEYDPRDLLSPAFQPDWIISGFNELPAIINGKRTVSL